MTNLEQQIKDWQKLRFPYVDMFQKYRKLCEEIGELGEALMRDIDIDIETEIGDVGVVLAGMSALMNKSLTNCMALAMEKNYRRERSYETRKQSKTPVQKRFEKGPKN